METSRLIRAQDLMKLLGNIDRSTLHRLQKLQDFPKKIKLSAKNNAWRLKEVEQWLNTKQCC